MRIHVEEISTTADLDDLRDDWLRLHARDQRATVFVSWWWLRAWADVSPYPWSVLVAREHASGRVGGPVVALLPLSRRGSRAAYRLDQLREIHLMGDPAADYRGLICDPQRESDAIQALAEYLRRDEWWDRIVLKDVMDARLPALIDHLVSGEPGLHITEGDGEACPLLELPGSWEEYLKECLTQPSRKSLKKRLHVAEEHGCHVRTLRDCRNDAEVKRHVHSLLRVAGRHKHNDPAHLAWCERMLNSCIVGECAEVAVLHLGDGQPIAAQGSVFDHHARSIAHYVTGFDEESASLSPGRVLDALCIHDAIVRGWRYVDFLRGNEPYKHQLGARPRFTRRAVIARKRLASRTRALLSGVRERSGW